MKNSFHRGQDPLFRRFYKTGKHIRKDPRMFLEIYCSIVESAGDSIYLVDKSCRYLFMNKAHLARLGLSLDDIVGRSYGEYHAEDQEKAFKEDVAEVCETGRKVQREHRSSRDDKYFLRTFSPMKDPANNEIIGVTIVSKDVSELKRAQEALQESEEKYRMMLNTIEDGYYEVNLSGDFTFINPSMCRILGYSEEELLTMEGKKYLDEENAKIVYRAFDEVHRTGMPAKHVGWELVRKDGAAVFVGSSISLRRDSSGEPVGFRGILHDLTDRKKMEQEIIALSLSDPLTGLYNRRGFMTLAEQQLKSAAREKKGSLLLFADLDDTKKINDRLGHQRGDAALTEVAEILKEVFRESDIIARIGGDEFAVLTVGTTEDHALSLQERLQHRIGIHNDRPGRTYRISMSMGTAFREAADPALLSEMMSLADSRMYEEKKGKNRPG